MFVDRTQRKLVLIADSDLEFELSIDAFRHNINPEMEIVMTREQYEAWKKGEEHNDR